MSDCVCSVTYEQLLICRAWCRKLDAVNLCDRKTKSPFLDGEGGFEERSGVSHGVTNPDHTSLLK